MNDAGLATFETAIGTCGIAWGPRGIVGVQLPDPEALGTLKLLRRHFPTLASREPVGEIADAIGSIQALLEGQPLDLTSLRLDWQDVPAFNRRVYEITRRIAPGRTRTYGDIANDLGDKALARAVGQALGRNPFAPVIPCHRVLAAGGAFGGFSAPGGTAAKLRMLAIEKARPPGNEPSLF